MKKTILLLITVSILSQCSFFQEQKISIEKAFYYWQTTMKFDSTDNNLANNLGLKTLYIRYFDVDYSPGYESGIPVGLLKFNEDKKLNIDSFNIIPTVFITNRTFKNLDKKGIAELVENLNRKLLQLSFDLQYNRSNYHVRYESWEDFDKENSLFIKKIQEIQIDCDWTASTRDNFFHFLELLKPKLNGRELSCTIRLHQYKDRKIMGIPPVKRGLLMCYNVSDVRDYQTQNAILEYNIVEQYLKGRTYPMKLDIGLPMFSWAAWYRQKEFKGVLSGWNELDAQNDALYSKKTGQFFQIKQDTAIGNNYLREGDLLRWDGGFKEEIEKTIQLLYKELDLEGIRIAFFDWKTDKIKRHEKELEDYYNKFE